MSFVGSGFVVLHRQLLDWEWYQDINVKTLFLHLLLKANWKEKRYQGIVIPRGSLATTREALSQETGLTVQQVRTCIAKLKSTNEISTKITNKFTIISIDNYSLYQDKKTKITIEQPTNNQQSTIEQPANNQLSYNVEQSNNVTKKQNTPPLPPTGSSTTSQSVEEGVCDFSAPEILQETKPMQKSVPKKTDAPSKGTPEWSAFLTCWESYPVKQGQEDAWKEWMRLKANGTLALAWEIRDSILTHIAEDTRWQRGMVPEFSRWLKGKRWNDKPYVGSQQQSLKALSPEEQDEVDKIFGQGRYSKFYQENYGDR